MYSFALICFYVNFWWAHFVNLLWSVYWFLPWIWKRVLIRFSRKSPTSPSLVAQAQQDAFWLAFTSFFFMFLRKCHTSNWWFILGSFSLMYLHIWAWWSVVICLGVTFLSLNICNVLINPFFSVWLELSSSETWIRALAAILPVFFVYQFLFNVSV